MKKTSQHISKLIITALLLAFIYNTDSSAQCSAVAGVLTAEDTTRCVNEATTILLTGSSGTLTWQSQIGTSAWVPVPGPSTTTKSVVPETTRNYRAFLYDDIHNCSAVSNIITIHVSSFSDIPETGIDGAVCGTNILPFVVAETPTAPRTGFWSKVSGPGNVSIIPNNSPNPTLATVSSYGNYILGWNITDGTCTKQAQVSITSYQQVNANAGQDIFHCSVPLTAVFKLSATHSLQGTSGIWTVPPGIIVDTLTSPTSTAKGNSGTYKLVWKEINGTCSDNDTIEVNIARQPVSNAGTSGSECDKDRILNAVPSRGAGLWKALSGPGIINFSDVNNANSTVQASIYGENYILQWKETNGFCSDSDTVVLNFYEQPDAQLGNIKSDMCGVNTTLLANPSVGTGTWSVLPDQPPATVNQISDSSAIASIPGSTYGIFNFRWKEVNGVCSDSADIPITFTQQPIANAGTNNSACSLNIGLKAFPSVGSGKWISLTGSESLVFSNRNSANTNVSSDNYGNYNIAWVETNSYCADTMPLTLHFNEQPVAYAGLSDTICGFSKNLNATTSVGSGHWIVTPTANPGFTNPNDANTVLSVGSEGNYHIQWIAVNGSCSDTSQIDILFHETPNAQAGKDTTVCGQELQLNASPLIGFWTIENGADNLEVNPGMNSPNAMISCKNYGTYHLNWIATNSNCSDTSSVQLVFLQKPVANAGEDISLDNEFETEIHASEPLTTENGVWNLVSGTGDLTNQNSATTQVRNLTIGENLFTWNVLNSADNQCSTTDTLLITVYDIFIPEVITPNSGTKNETFYISGIDMLDNVELTIFNRWGLEVYHNTSYEDENNWNGTNENGQELTNDTYFYVLVAGSRTFKKFVVIKR